MSTQNDVLRQTYDARMARPRAQKPRIHRGKDGYWRFRAYVDRREGTEIERRQKMYVVGNMDSKRAAESRMREMLRELDNRPAIIQATTPMKAILDAYEETFLPTLANNTEVLYRAIVKSRIRPTFDSIPAHQCNVKVVQDWMNAMMAEGLARNSLKCYNAILKSVFDCAQKWGYIDRNLKNPTDDVRIPRATSTAPRELPALTLEQIRRLLAVADAMDTVPIDARNQTRLNSKKNRGGVSLGFANMVRIGLYGGLRIGEILFLRWKHVQPPALIVAGSRNPRGIDGATKRPTSRRQVPLGPVMLVRPVDARDEDRVFDWWEYSKAKMWIRRAFDRIGVRLGDGDGWHSLRRTHMTVMKRCGAGDMRDQLGHVSEQTSAIYLRDTFGMHEAALERFADMVIGRIQ